MLPDPATCPCAEARVSRSKAARIIDLPGTTLLPGLIDTHVHLGGPMVDRPEAIGAGAVLAGFWDQFRHMSTRRHPISKYGGNAWVIEQHNLKRASDAGVPIGLGTDANNPQVSLGRQYRQDCARMHRKPATA